MRLSRLCVRSRPAAIFICLLLIGLIIAFANIYELRKLHDDHVQIRQSLEGSTSRVVWILGKNLETGYLKHVSRVFERIGFSRATSRSDWDVLWSYHYPFGDKKLQLHSLKPSQRVNHFPGCGHITGKVDLVLSGIKNIPKAFAIPVQKEELLIYAKAHRLAQWVQKSNKHRGIRIKSVSELDLESPNTFVQQYIDNPFLIDGRRLDVGIYVTYTSVDPLTVYEGDWLLRFCPHEYYPFDSSDLDKYVIDDHYKPIYEMPSLMQSYKENGGSAKDTFLQYIRDQGHDADKLRSDLLASVREVYLNKEQLIANIVNGYASKRNFFELVRVDFIIDKNLKIYLMEVNMSPNLSSGHYPANRLMYEQIMYSMLRLVGLSSLPMWQHSNSEADEAQMQVANRDLSVVSKRCSVLQCQHKCEHKECWLCPSCLKNEQLENLKFAFLEHNNRMTWRRILPKPFQSQAAARSWRADDDEEFSAMTKNNQLLATWFMHKCLQDATWCS